MSEAKVLLTQDCQSEAAEVMSLVSALNPAGKEVLMAFLNGVRYGQLRTQTNGPDSA